MNVVEDLTPSVEQPFKFIFTPNNAGDVHVKWGGIQQLPSLQECRAVLSVIDMIPRIIFSDPHTVTSKYSC